MNRRSLGSHLSINNSIRRLALLPALSIVVISRVSYAQQSSSVTNNAAPTATVSTNANGGTQINQQVNNAFDTSFGFGPGIICKTPQLVITGSSGYTGGSFDVAPGPAGNDQITSDYAGSISVAIPIGSSIIQDCQKFAAQIAKDRVISSELSLIRACAELSKEKLTIDPIKYPNLAKCLPDYKPDTTADNPTPLIKRRTL